MSNKVHILNHSNKYRVAYCGKKNVIMVEKDENIEHSDCIVCKGSYTNPIIGVREKGLPMVNTFRMSHYYMPRGRYQSMGHRKFRNYIASYIRGILDNYYKLDVDYSTSDNIYKYIMAYYSERPYEFPSKRELFHLITERMLVG